MTPLFQKLESQWNAGNLRTLEADLDTFIRENREEICSAMTDGHPKTLDVARRRHGRGEISDMDLLDLSVRALLMRRRSCNPARDIHEQLAEIERWASESGEPGDRAARTWSSRHARDWREWRLYQMLYIWQKKADHYLGLLSVRAA